MTNEVVMMRGRRILLTLVLAVCVGCSSDSDDSGQPGDVPPAARVGDCRNTPESILDPGAAFDDSPVVDCSQTHTLQTLTVIQTEGEMTPERLEDFSKYCQSGAVFKYLDSPGPGPYKLNYPVFFGPTREQQDAGQSWIRCDAGFYGDTFAEDLLVPQTGSLEGAMGKNIARFQQCIAEVPDPERSQEFVSCEEPHRAELLLTIMKIDENAYPPAPQREAEGQSMCHHLVADRDDAEALVLTPLWQDKQYWHDGKVELGCWIHRKTGLLPAA